MKIAVFSDIHGNLPALEAVLHEIDLRHPDLVLCGGDLVGYGAFPNQVIETIRRNRIMTVMGNYDDGVAFHRIECGCNYKDEKAAELGRRSIVWTKEHVTPENKVFLQGLMQQLQFTVFDRKIRLVHGSPRRINEYLTLDFPEDAVGGMMNDEGLEILICGHTHIPYVKEFNGKYLINTGSVGKPKDGNPQAGFIMITLTKEKVETEIVRVAYNVEAMVKAMLETDLPQEFADALRIAR